MNNSGYCSLIIKGNGIDFYKVEEKIKLKLSGKFKKGDIVSTVLPKMEFDLIRFDIQMKDTESPNDVIKTLIEKLASSASYIDKLQKDFDVYLKIFVQSDSAQVNYKISTKVLGELNKLNLDLEFSILSWGGEGE